MLHKKSWQNIGFFLLVLIGVLAFTAVIAARFQRGNTSPSTGNAPQAVQQIKAESIALTEKTELPQTEMIVVEPSNVVTNAEKSLPGLTGDKYRTACLKLKELYLSENSSKLAEEEKRYEQAQQYIINTFSAAGMSFSAKHKTIQSLEGKRHDSVLKQLESQLQKQLSTLRC